MVVVQHGDLALAYKASRNATNRCPTQYSKAKRHRCEPMLASAGKTIWRGDQAFVLQLHVQVPKNTHTVGDTIHGVGRYSTILKLNQILLPLITVPMVSIISNEERCTYHPHPIKVV